MTQQTPTPRQLASIELLRKTCLGSRHSFEYEVKEFTVNGPSNGSRLVFVKVVIGRRRDEGTMAEVCCRDARLYRVGPRGGIALLNRDRC